MSLTLIAQCICGHTVTFSYFLAILFSRLSVTCVDKIIAEN